MANLARVARARDDAVPPAAILTDRDIRQMAESQNINPSSIESAFSLGIFFYAFEAGKLPLAKFARGENAKFTDMIWRDMHLRGIDHKAALVVVTTDKAVLTKEHMIEKHCLSHTEHTHAAWLKQNRRDPAGHITPMLRDDAPLQLLCGTQTQAALASLVEQVQKSPEAAADWRKWHPIEPVPIPVMAVHVFRAFALDDHQKSTMEAYVGLKNAAKPSTLIKPHRLLLASQFLDDLRDSEGRLTKELDYYNNLPHIHAALREGTVRKDNIPPILYMRVRSSRNFGDLFDTAIQYPAFERSHVPEEWFSSFKYGLGTVFEEIWTQIAYSMLLLYGKHPQPGKPYTLPYYQGNDTRMREICTKETFHLLIKLIKKNNIRLPRTQAEYDDCIDKLTAFAQQCVNKNTDSVMKPWLECSEWIPAFETFRANPSGMCPAGDDFLVSDEEITAVCTKLHSKGNRFMYTPLKTLYRKMSGVSENNTPLDVVKLVEAALIFQKEDDVEAKIWGFKRALCTYAKKARKVTLPAKDTSFADYLHGLDDTNAVKALFKVLNGFVAAARAKDQADADGASPTIAVTPAAGRGSTRSTRSQTVGQKRTASTVSALEEPEQQPPRTKPMYKETDDDSDNDGSPKAKVGKRAKPLFRDSSQASEGTSSSRTAATGTAHASTKSGGTSREDSRILGICRKLTVEEIAGWIPGDAGNGLKEFCHTMHAMFGDDPTDKTAKRFDTDIMAAIVRYAGDKWDAFEEGTLPEFHSRKGPRLENIRNDRQTPRGSEADHSAKCKDMLERFHIYAVNLPADALLWDHAGQAEVPQTVILRALLSQTFDECQVQKNGTRGKTSQFYLYFPKTKSCPSPPDLDHNIKALLATVEQGVEPYHVHTTDSMMRLDIVHQYATGDVATESLEYDDYVPPVREACELTPGPDEEEDMHSEGHTDDEEGSDDAQNATDHVKLSQELYEQQANVVLSENSTDEESQETALPLGAMSPAKSGSPRKRPEAERRRQAAQDLTSGGSPRKR